MFANTLNVVQIKPTTQLTLNDMMNAVNCTPNDSSLKQEKKEGDMPVKYVKCKWSDAYVMDCKYDTICYDGKVTYVVVGETDNEVDLFMKNDPFQKQREYNGDGTVWRRPPDSILHKFEADKFMVENVRPILRVEDYHGVSRSFLDKVEATWLADDTFFVNPGNPWSHPYADLTAVGPLWNAVHDMLTGVTENPSFGGVFMNHWPPCSGHFRDSIVNASLLAWPGEATHTTRSDIWPEETISSKTVYQCNFRNENIKPKNRMVCGRNAHHLGFSYVPLTGSLSRRYLLNILLKVLGDHTRLDGQQFIPKAANVSVAVVDRQQVVSRRFADPKSIISVVQSTRQGKRFGIDVTYVPALSALTTLEQVSLFAKTDVIVMAHGAGIAHAVWMKPNSALIEIIPYGWNTRAYRELYSASGGYYQDVLAIPVFTNMTAQAVTHAYACVRSPPNWNQSVYLSEQNCYNTAFKAAAVTIDDNELKYALNRAYRRLATEKR
eukprot:CFRG7725T1